MIDATFVFTVIAAILIIGFLGDLFFKKTGIPFFIFLIVIGIVLGPILNVFPREPLLPALAIFAELTLLMVLFYGGLDTRFDAALRGGGRAFIQVAIYVLASTTIIGLLVNLLIGWDILQSFIFASMVGGETTAAVVIPLCRSLNFEEVTVAFLTLETAMNTIFSIVLFFTFVGAYSTGGEQLALSTYYNCRGFWRGHRHRNFARHRMGLHSALPSEAEVHLRLDVGLNFRNIYALD
jgi:NhaP-type Na+/H+ and K+/H+ antiporter